jgi:uncharacterized membrane protein
MNPAHLHLILNHFPIITPIIGLLVMISGIALKSEIIKRVAYVLLIMGAVSAFAAAATGDGAEEVVEHIQGISHKLIHEHEEKAELFAILSYILAAISGFGLWANWKQKPFSNLISFVTIAFCAVTLFFAQQTGTSGGEIRHTEMNGQSVNAPTNGGEQEEKEEH